MLYAFVDQLHQVIIISQIFKIALARKNDKATQTLEEALEIANRCGARYYAGFAQRLMGEMALKTNPAQAASHFERSIVVLREIKAEIELALAYVSYGRLQKQQKQIA